jgi:hypothetical protein
VRANLGALVEDTLAAVRAENPVYREILGGPEGLGIRLGIEQAIDAFLDAIEHGERPPVETGEVWRRLGEAEFQAGRSLEALRGAFRSGTRAVWRSAAGIATAAGVSAPEVIALAEGIFVYTDELAADVVEGYLQAKSDEAGERERRRRRLAALLLDAEHHDMEAIERAADLARWPLPRELAVVALSGADAHGVAGRLDRDALAGGDAHGGWVIVSDPDGPGRQAALTHALAGAAGAVGPTVSPREAPRSLRWARLVLALIERGSLPPESPARSAQHLATLILLQDPELAAELASSRLAPLDSVAPADRERLLETLEAWLSHQRHTPTIAGVLHVHPQTVRYRLATLRELLGDALQTPQGRFELALALRARRALAGQRVPAPSPESDGGVGSRRTAIQRSVHGRGDQDPH